MQRCRRDSAPRASWHGRSADGAKRARPKSIPCRCALANRRHFRPRRGDHRGDTPGKMPRLRPHERSYSSQEKATSCQLPLPAALSCSTKQARGTCRAGCRKRGKPRYNELLISERGSHIVIKHSGKATSLRAHSTYQQQAPFGLPGTEISDVSSSVPKSNIAVQCKRRLRIRATGLHSRW